MRVSHDPNRACLWGGLLLLVVAGVGCGSDGQAPTGTDTVIPDGPNTETCRPLSKQYEPGTALMLPCEATTEPCDGLDNDGDGLVDPHCPTPCSADADCTFGGVVVDAACNADASGQGVCGSIHTIPSDGAHAECAGRLCAWNEQCVEGACVGPGDHAPDAPCANGGDCGLGAGCVVGPETSQEQEYEVGRCRLRCQDTPCPTGHLCLNRVDSSVAPPLTRRECSARYFCEGSLQSCSLPLEACLSSGACFAVLACFSEHIDGVEDRSPLEPALPLIGMDEMPLVSCWENGAEDAITQALRSCLKTSCEACWSCENKQCGDDGCGGSCGSCEDGTQCTDYLSSDQLGTLPAGQCVCLAYCLDKDCGDDGCGGSCGSCDESGTQCDLDTGKCVCFPSCAGKQCGVDGCGKSCGQCLDAQTCSEDGLCECVGDCTDKVCGDDGCGGSCGTCTDDGKICDETLGQCVCFPTCANKACGVDGCGNSCGTCPTGQSCSPDGECGCYPECGTKACGVDGCGTVCGTCPSGETCSPDGVCECLPDCAGKSCGSDGCGAQCGTCLAGELCSDQGQCQCTTPCGDKECGEDACGNVCGTCPAQSTCDGAGSCVCTPDCTFKSCGGDGCGGECGTCAPTQTCTAVGECVDASGSCVGQCGAPIDGDGCKCDESCFNFGDCCPDICAVCATEFQAQCND